MAVEFRSKDIVEFPLRLFNTVFLPIDAQGVYFFNQGLRGASIGGGRLLEGGRLFFQPMFEFGVRWKERASFLLVATSA